MNIVHYAGSWAVPIRYDLDDEDLEEEDDWAVSDEPQVNTVKISLIKTPDMMINRRAV